MYIHSRYRIIAPLIVLLAGCSDISGPNWLKSVGSSTIASENRIAGDSTWYTPTSRLASASVLSIWASPYSAGPGDTLEVRIHALYGPVRVQLFRLGWYSGAGSALKWQRSGVPAGAQPACGGPVLGPVVCPWTVTERIPVDSTWRSGLYMLKVVDSTGQRALYPLVLRGLADASIAVVVPQFTWQAYNNFGGTSLYTTTTGSYGTTVSFERPYHLAPRSLELLNDSYTQDLRVMRWLERNDYGVTYISDVDLALGHPLPHGMKILMFAGHDEYWTWNERQRVDSLLAAHTHMIFFSGNNACWNTRLSTGTVTGRAAYVLTSWKFRTDPNPPDQYSTTTQFRLPPLNHPENQLGGIMFEQLTTPGVFQPAVVNDSNDQGEGRAFLRAAGLTRGAVIPDIISGEGDQIANNGDTPSDLQVLFRSPIVHRSDMPNFPAFYYTTFYIAPSGAGVFASGSNSFGRGLDGFGGTPSSPPLQRLMDAVVVWMLDH